MVLIFGFPENHRTFVVIGLPVEADASLSVSIRRRNLDYTAYMQLYITAKTISYCNYPISKMCCPIVSVIFGKALYLIPQKIPSKRYGKFSACHTYIKLIDYQTTICPILPQTSLAKRKGS